LSRARRPLAGLGSVAAIALVVACSGETALQPPTPPVNWHSFSRPVVDAGANSPTAKESTLAQQYADALASPGFGLLGHLLDSDAQFMFPGPSMDSVQGRDAVVQAHTALFGAFDRRRFVLSRILRTATEQCVEWTMSGVQQRDWMGVAATERPISIKGATLLWTKDDGTLSDVHVYFDVAAVKALLGAGPRELEGLAAPAMPTGPAQITEASGQQPDNAAIVRTARDAFDTDDENAFVATMTDDVAVYSLDRDEPRRGREERRAYFRAMIKAIAQLDTTITSSTSVGPYAIVEYSLTGEQLAPIGWVPLLRNRVVKLHLLEVAEIENAKIAKVWRYENLSEMATPGP
jgi:hypothetical protein